MYPVQTIRCPWDLRDNGVARFTESRRPGGCCVFAGWMDAAGGADAPGTWHYGVVAQWRPEFHPGGPEIACFRAFIERYGNLRWTWPAERAGCC
jgi:hypothetical protein